MKRLFKFLFIALMLGSAFLCQADQGPKTKPASFYQHMLEQFCQRYYHDCFGRQYFQNSLVVTRMSINSANNRGDKIISWNMYVKGIHSFKGKMNRYNDDPFEAFVYDRGQNNYEITFIVKKHYLIGEDKEMRATRIMTFYE